MIPTAEKFLKSLNTRSENQEADDLIFDDVKDKMIEFAKLHVEAALKEASENVEVICDSSDIFQSIDENSILKSYPLENIK